MSVIRPRATTRAALLASVSAYCVLALTGPAARAQVTNFTIDSTNATIATFTASVSSLGNSVLANPQNLTTGANSFKYAAVTFVPTATRTYKFGQTSAPLDTVMILYGAAFNPLNPGANALVGNDDTSAATHLAAGATVTGCGSSTSYCPQITRSLTANTTYSLLVSSFSAGANVTLPMSFYADGPGVFATLLAGGGQVTASGTNSANINLGNGGGTIAVTGTATLSGTISGEGGLTTSGGGTVTISGANSYTGGSTLNTATTITHGSALGTGAVTNNSTLTVTVVGGSNSTELANRISGTGVLTTSGGGTVTISGANSYTGGSTLNTATTITHGSALGTGNIINNSILTANTSTNGTITINNTISGTGSLTTSGGGTVSISGANSYTGGSTLNTATTITHGSALGTGNLFNNSNLTANTSTNSNMIINNIISGTGSLTTSGGGTVTISGANSYTGGSTLNTPTIMFIGSALGVGNIVNNSILTATTSTNSTITINNIISGTGSLITNGSGAIAITGANSYTGGTTLGAPTTITNGSALGTGAVTNTSTLTVNATTPGGTQTVANNITGGTLSMTGPGTTNLSGTSTIQSASISAGRTNITGTLRSTNTVTVSGGATLGGTGRMSSVSLSSGARLAAGRSIGTLTIDGDLTLAAEATTEIEYSATAADRLEVTGIASLNGTLEAVAESAAPLGTRHVIISAAGGVTGGFTGLTQPTSNLAAGTRVDTIYAPTSVTLAITPDRYRDLSAHGIALSPQQQAVGAALDGARPAAGTRPGGTVATLFDRLYALDSGHLSGAMTQLRGEIHTAAGPIARRAGDDFLGAMLDPAAAGRGLGRQTTEIWVSVLGSRTVTEGSASIGTAERRAQVSGVASGLDVRIGADTILGAAINGGPAKAQLGDGNGKLEANIFQGGLYGSTRFGGLSLGAAVSVALLDFDTARTPSLLGGERIAASYRGSSLNGRFEGSYAFDVADWLSVAPFTAMQAGQTRLPRFTETADAGGIALTGEGRDESGARGELGVHLGLRGDVGGMGAAGFLRAGWGHALGEDTPGLRASFAGIGSPGFDVAGAKAGRDSAMVAAGFDLRITSGISLGAQIENTITNNAHDISGRAKLRLAF